MQAYVPNCCSCVEQYSSHAALLIDALVTVVYDSGIVSEILQTLVGNVQCADIFECKDKHLIHHNIMKKGWTKLQEQTNFCACNFLCPWCAPLILKILKVH